MNLTHYSVKGPNGAGESTIPSVSRPVVILHHVLTIIIVIALGKSTLIKMLMGKDEPDSGTIQIGETVSMVGVGQERMEQLDDSKTVFEGKHIWVILHT